MEICTYSFNVSNVSHGHVREKETEERWWLVFSVPANWEKKLLKT